MVHFKRSGGATARPFTTMVDTDRLSPADVQTLRYMVEDSGFFQMPPIVSEVVPHPQCDQNT